MDIKLVSLDEYSALIEKVSQKLKEVRTKEGYMEGMRAELIGLKVQYEELFSAMPAGILTYGNVDIPALWPDYLRPDHTVLDAQTVEVGGMTWGFIGGGLVSPMRTPYEIPEQDYAAKIASLGAVDVLFTHIPPAVPDLTYDVVARRFEVGSAALLEYVREYQPRYHFFGHVHQPLATRFRIGRTECVNVGHFHSREKPFTIDL